MKYLRLTWLILTGRLSFQKRRRLDASITGDRVMRTEQATEKEIQSLGLNAPRLTPDKIDAAIASEQYHVFEGSQLTVCCLTLQNGFTVVGESACASPANFNAAIGQKIAREKAREKIWALEGYLLKERLHSGVII